MNSLWERLPTLKKRTYDNDMFETLYVSPIFFILFTSRSSRAIAQVNNERNILAM